MALVALFRGAEREIESDRELAARCGSANGDGDGEQLGVALYRPEGACCANAPPLAINGDAVAVRPLAVVAERRECRGQGDSRAEAVARSGGGSS